MEWPEVSRQVNMLILFIRNILIEYLVLISTLMEPSIGTLIEPAKVRDFRSDDLVWLCVYESPLQGERSLRGVL